MASEREPDPEMSDPDADARAEALRFMGRRFAIWSLPLSILGLLLVGLGIPWWISVTAMAIVLAIVVFEIDL